MILCSFFVASSFPIAYELNKNVPIEVSLFLRFTFSSIFFLPFILKSKNKLDLSAKTLFKNALVSFFSVSFFIGMFFSLQHTTALKTSSIYTLMPGFTFFFSLFFLKVLFSKKTLLCFSTALFSSIFIISRGELKLILSSPNFGDLIFLFATISMAIYNVSSKKLRGNQSVFHFTFWILFFSTFYTFLFYYKELIHFNYSLIEFADIFRIIYLILFCTIFSFFIIQYATKTIGPSKMSSFSYLTPVFVYLINLISGKFLFELKYLIPILSLLVCVIYMNGDKK